ncbi:MAG: YicC/YloC family endoribonuclease [Myxococcota bacterium]|jgi:uncharacterized protein (TIGR00255 family)|nr:YicC/YloC family endoribonuclease [Myxococcota bacterium]
MPLMSMTGFGEAETVLLGRRMRVEVRTVNHRYLEVRCRLPGPLQALEPEVQALVKQRVARGKLDLTITPAEVAAAGVAGGRIDVGLALAYWEQIRHLAGALGQSTPVPDLALLLSLPEVVRQEEPRADPEQVSAALRAAVDQALARLRTARQAEGAALAADLRARSRTLRELRDAVAARSPVAVQQMGQRLRERLARLLTLAPEGKASPDEARLAQELVLLTDRLDVQEELTRLDHHLTTLDRLLDEEAEGPQGRRLDFLVQELLRETNTIGSKANDAVITDCVVEMKTELERIREQVQNLE